MYKVDLIEGFIIELENGQYEMDDTMIVPSKAEYGRPQDYIEKHRVHEFKFVKNLKYKDKIITSGTLELISFTGYLKNYLSNRLNINRKYNIKNKFSNYSIQCRELLVDDGFGVDNKNKEYGVVLEISGEQKLLDKLMITNLLDMLNKIISKCEINYDLEAEYIDKDIYN